MPRFGGSPFDDARSRLPTVVVGSGTLPSELRSRVGVGGALVDRRERGGPPQHRRHALAFDEVERRRWRRSAPGTRSPIRCAARRPASALRRPRRTASRTARGDPGTTPGDRPSTRSTSCGPRCRACARPPWARRRCPTCRRRPRDRPGLTSRLHRGEQLVAETGVVDGVERDRRDPRALAPSHHPDRPQVGELGHVERTRSLASARPGTACSSCAS